MLVGMLWNLNPYEFPVWFCLAQMTTVALSLAVIVGVTAAWYCAALAAAVWPLQRGRYVGVLCCDNSSLTTSSHQCLKVASLVYSAGCHHPSLFYCPSNGLHCQIQRLCTDRLRQHVLRCYGAIMVSCDSNRQLPPSLTCP